MVSPCYKKHMFHGFRSLQDVHLQMLPWRNQTKLEVDRASDPIFRPNSIQGWLFFWLFWSCQRESRADVARKSRADTFKMVLGSAGPCFCQVERLLCLRLLRVLVWKVLQMVGVWDILNLEYSFINSNHRNSGVLLENQGPTLSRWF